MISKQDMLTCELKIRYLHKKFIQSREYIGVRGIVHTIAELTYYGKVKEFCTISVHKWNYVSETLILQKRRKPNSTQPTCIWRNCHYKNLFEKKFVENRVLFVKLMIWIHVFLWFEIRVFPTCCKNISFTLWFIWISAVNESLSNTYFSSLWWSKRLLPKIIPLFIFVKLHL